MKITKEQDNLIISSDYDPKVLEVVKTFDGRKYLPDQKVWTVPSVHGKEVLQKLAPLGFEIAEEVWKYVLIEENTRAELAKLQSAQDTNEDVFSKVKLPLFPYQKVGSLFMLKAGSALLGDAPGLGKTLQTITICEINESKKVLVLCPATLKYNWQEEIAKWTEKKSIVIDGSKDARSKQWEADSVYYIANYELLLRDEEEMKKISWDYILADEATRISNPRAKQSRAIKRIMAKNKIAMTGTPIANRPDDLWNILDFIRPGLMGSYWQFRNKYCLQDKWGGIVSYVNLKELKRAVSRLMIRRTKEEVLPELPEKLYQDIKFLLSPREESLYEAARKELWFAITQENVIDIPNILARFTRLKQITGSLELLGGSGSSKTEALKELLSDIIHNGQKAIVFTQFAQMAYILIRELGQYNPLLICGDVPKKERQEAVHAFNEQDDNRIIIMTEAGGFGLNLQRASYVVHYDFPWSVSKIVQREDRAHRIGQKSNVTVYNLIAKNTLDEYIFKVLYKKQEVSKMVLGDTDRINALGITKQDLARLVEK